MRWLEALIWPDHIDRIELHRAAVKEAQPDPPPVGRGEAMATLPGVLEEIGDGMLPCVFHSYTIYQMTPAWRGEWAALLGRLGSGRDLAWLSLEWLGDLRHAELRLTQWANGSATHRHLADAHHHGRWVHWRGPVATADHVDVER